MHWSGAGHNPATRGTWTRCSSGSAQATLSLARDRLGRKCPRHYGSAPAQRSRGHRFFRKLLKGLRYVPRVIVTDKLKNYAAGLSGISCAAGRLNQSGHSQCEALAKEDGELGLGHGPLARRHDPLLFGAVQDQEEKLGSGFVSGEMTPGANRPAQLGIERFNSIGRVQNPPDIGGKRIKRDNFAPGPAPALADGRVFLAPRPVLEGGQCGLAGIGIDGPVNVLESGGSLRSFQETKSRL
jgi:hypothetical protein